MRDIHKDIEYFNRLIFDIKESIERKINWIDIGKTQADKIYFSKRSIVWDYISLIGAKYSVGLNKIDFINDLEEAISKCNESWDGFWKLKGRDEKEYDQYILSAYDEMLWMLSLGYLLNIPNDTFKLLVDIIDRDKVKDNLFEFIISAKLKDRQPIKEESYRDYFGIPETFAKLREAIKETDKAKAEKLVKEFITKDWYNNHKDAGWYNSHKSKHNVYFGYWSFETAAVVKIMGLNDASFRDCQYYPKDLA